MDGHNLRSIVIRPAEVVDVEGIAAVHATSWRETYGRFVVNPDTDPWFDVDRRIDMWRTNLEQDAFATFVAEDESGVIGFAATQETPGSDAVRPEELTMLYVLSRAHGGGAGQALLNAALGPRPAAPSTRPPSDASTYESTTPPGGITSNSTPPMATPSHAS